MHAPRVPPKQGSPNSKPKSLASVLSAQPSLRLSTLAYSRLAQPSQLFQHASYLLRRVLHASTVPLLTPAAPQLFCPKSLDPHSRIPSPSPSLIIQRHAIHFPFRFCLAPSRMSLRLQILHPQIVLRLIALHRRSRNLVASPATYISTQNTFRPRIRSRKAPHAHSLPEIKNMLYRPPFAPPCILKHFRRL